TIYYKDWGAKDVQPIVCKQPPKPFQRALLPLLVEGRAVSVVAPRGKRRSGINRCRLVASALPGTAAHASLPTGSTAATRRWPPAPGPRLPRSFEDPPAATAAD